MKNKLFLNYILQLPIVDDPTIQAVEISGSGSELPLPQADRKALNTTSIKVGRNFIILMMSPPLKSLSEFINSS